MKKQNVIEIGNENFICKDFWKAPASGYDIYDVYNRPSRIKVNIWNYWKRWADENGFELKITGANSCMFTIEGYNDMYYIKITKYHNYIKEA